MNRSLGKNITLGFGAALFLLGVVVVVSVKSIRQFVSNNQWEDHTRQVLSTIADLSSQVRDAETAGRGYVISGDEQFLAPYRAAAAGADPKMRELRALTSDNAAQQRRLDRLEPLVRAKLAFVGKTVAVRGSQGFEPAQQRVMTGQGRRLMDEIGQVLTAMREEEDRLLASRSAAAVISARVTTAVISCGGALAVALVSVAGLLIRRDMAARKRAEEELGRFFTLSLDMLCIAGSDGYFKRLSPVWTRTLGFTQDELLTTRYIELVHPEDRAATEAEARTLTGGTATTSFENRYRCKDGSYRWLMWSTAPAPDGKLLYATARDITERKRTEDEIKKLNATLQQHASRLESANGELEAFSYSVSHDLRAPLRSIDGFSLALMEDYADKLEPEAKDYLQRVRAATQRMGQLIDDLLGLSRVTRSEMSRSTVDLTGMARTVAAELQKAQSDRQVDFVIADGLTAEGDPRLLRVVLDNLLGNAWKFTAKRSGARIEFGLSGENGSRQFFVRDNGAGFDMTYAHKLFGAFQRLHGNAEFAGTGVGLATVQRIIHRHGGRISAEGAVGKGATFRFTL